LSIDLAKAGFQNVQERISAIDTKVSVTVGLLVVLLPAPLVVIGWLTGLNGPTGTNILNSCWRCWFSSLMAACFLLAGMLSAFYAILKGISCLSPRGPKGYGINRPFRNEWQPNVLFPIHKPDKTQAFCEHLQKLQAGVDPPFVITEYNHQLQQLGRILDAKFTDMRICFRWLHICLGCYGITVLCSAYVGLTAMFRAIFSH